MHIARLLPRVQIEFGEYVGQRFLSLPAASILPALNALKTRLLFDFLVDITAVDWPQRELRFDLVYILYSYSLNQRLRIKTQIADATPAPSATGLYKAANWLEREIWDMFGIPFTGHPDLKRILMPDEWTGHPLRKDYSILLQDQAWVQTNLGIENGQ